MLLGTYLKNDEDLRSDVNSRLEPPQRQKALQPSQLTNGINRLASDLRMLIDMFDSILHEEYTPNHASLPTVSTSSKLDLDELPAIFAPRSPSKRQSKLSVKASNVGGREEPAGPAHNFACDFCGADIFQSFFECSGCSLDEDGPQRLGDGLLICPSCYAEGRTCACKQAMYAVQCRPFTDLLGNRNEAARVLQSLSNNHAGTGHKGQYAPLSEKYNSTFLAHRKPNSCVTQGYRQVRACGNLSSRMQAYGFEAGIV